MGQHVEREAGVLQPPTAVLGCGDLHHAGDGSLWVTAALTLLQGTALCSPDSCVSSVGLLEISPVERGVVSIFGVRSGLFVAMNSKGKLYGSVSSQGACAWGGDHGQTG